MRARFEGRRPGGEAQYRNDATPNSISFKARRFRVTILSLGSRCVLVAPRTTEVYYISYSCLVIGNIAKNPGKYSATDNNL